MPLPTTDGKERVMKITLDRREAIKLLLLLDEALGGDVAQEYEVIRLKIKEAVDKWDNQHLKK